MCLGVLDRRFVLGDEDDHLFAPVKRVVRDHLQPVGKGNTLDFPQVGKGVFPDALHTLVDGDIKDLVALIIPWCAAPAARGRSGRSPRASA